MKPDPHYPPIKDEPNPEWEQAHDERGKAITDYKRADHDMRTAWDTGEKVRAAIRKAAANERIRAAELRMREVDRRPWGKNRPW